MSEWTDNRHRLVCEYFESEDDFSLEVVHPQSCKVWYGCERRGTFDEPHILNWPGGCPPHAHAHYRYDCPLGYLEENVGLPEALMLGKWDITTIDGKRQVDDFQREAFDRFRANIDKPLAVNLNFRWWKSYSMDWIGPEYNEELTWEFAS